MEFRSLNQNNSNYKKGFLIKAKNPEIENLWLKVNTLKAN